MAQPAQHRWAGPIAKVIDLYAKNVEVNGASARTILAGLVPGILANNYYNASEAPDFYNNWIDDSLHKEPQWGDAIRQAAASGDPSAFEGEVARFGNAVIEWVRAARP